MNAKSNWFEEIEKEFNERKNIYTGYIVPDNFAEYIINNKYEKRNELCWMFNNDDVIKANYINWLENQFESFNVINLNLLDPTDELFSTYQEIYNQAYNK